MYSFPLKSLRSCMIAMLPLQHAVCTSDMMHPSRLLADHNCIMRSALLISERVLAFQVTAEKLVKAGLELYMSKNVYQNLCM